MHSRNTGTAAGQFGPVDACDDCGMTLSVPRVSVVVAAFLATSMLVFVPTSAATNTADPVPTARSLAGVTASLNPYVAGFQSPTAVAAAQDGRGRLFVAERAGVIRVVKSGKRYKTPYLNIKSKVGSSSGEQGLLGLAFSPGFKRNGTLFVTYTAKNGALVLARAKAKKPGKNKVPKSSVKTVLTVPHPDATNHNGGSLAFGSDGLLYLGTGDGGGGGDPQRRAQRLTSPLGKILRLNVNKSCGKKRYCVPAKNTYRKAPSSTKRLVFANGLRNPWKISIDRATGNLWVADVGQGKYEEVNVVSPAQRTVNFGWSCKEGPAGFNNDQCGNLAGYVAPVATLCHEGEVAGCSAPLIGKSIIGGHVYRGRSNLSLVGAYVFADFITGRVFAYRDGQTRQLASLGYVTSFGESEEGELFAVTYSGTLYRLG